MNKTEAAAYLGISVRSLERYTTDNRLSVRYERGKTKPTPAYDAADLDRFREELNRVVHRPVVERMEAAGQNSPEPANTSMVPVAQFGAIVELLREHLPAAPLAPTVPVADLLLLTLAQAQLLTGLSRARLRAAIDAGDLAAVRIGRAWRVKRAALEVYIGQL